MKNDFKIEPFSSESSIDDALNKIELLHKRAIEYTKSLLDRQVIERIYQLIKNAKYIEICEYPLLFLTFPYFDLYVLNKCKLYHLVFFALSIEDALDLNVSV